MNKELLTLKNDHIEVIVDPSHGAELLRVARPGDAKEGNALAHYDWETPTRARDGQRYGSTVLDWLSDYRGGWQECFPNSGREGSNAGVMTPFHGEASTTAWTVVDANSEEMTLRVATHIPLVLTRRMRLRPDAPVLLIDERVENVGTFDLDFVWAHHPVFPAVPGSRIDLPTCRVAVERSDADGLDPRGGKWPIVRGMDADVDMRVLPDGTHHRLTYHHELAEGWFALRPPARSPNPGVAIAWDLATWPQLWMWLLTYAEEFPWFGRAQHVGLEPNRGTSVDGIEGAKYRSEQLRLAPGEIQKAWLTLRLLSAGSAAVQGLDRQGAISVAE
jgi:galactose mutarotase-like enzyme